MGGRTIVISDIHGCHDTLRHLMDRVGPTAADTLIFLGDYIDRGPDSRKVVDFLLELQQEFPRFIALKGNHEQMLADFLAGRNRENYLRYGGKETLSSYGLGAECGRDDFPASHLHFFQELLSFWEDEAYLYAHAGIEPGVPLSMQSNKALIWGLSRFLSPGAFFPKTVIYGHVHRVEPLVESNRIGIDTGAVYGGRLTALLLPEQRFISVPGEPCRQA